jgi:serine/threonine-protein kinase
MSTLSPDRWQEASQYLDQALAMSSEERAVWLASLQEQNPDLAALLQALLDEHQVLAEEHFLEELPVSLFGQPALAGQTIAAYTLLSPIGEGGMGTVWLAERSDGRFERRVALKFLRIALASRGGEERFKREGSILGRLTHPHIAELLDAGTSRNGQPYLVLEYVEGTHIDQYCDQHGLKVEERARLFLGVLDAVAHAHANLIVHRDLKPSNVLVSNDAVVKLLDFGIAKLLESEGQDTGPTLLTREGGRLFTPQYAAPEQLCGGTVTTATDVYALGVLLYVLLTGQHPAGDGPRTPADLVRAIVDTEPPRLSDIVTRENGSAESAAAPAARRSTTPDKLGRSLRGDLDTIVAKTLKKNPHERYPSVTALADDLRRYLGHQPISARPDTLAYRAAKFVRRNRTPVALAALIIVTLIVGIGGTLIQAHTARRQRDVALRERDRANRIADFMTDMFKVSQPNEARGNSITAREILDKASKQIDLSLAKDPDLQAQMMSTMGKTYTSLGLYTAAQPLLEHAIEVGRRANGPGNPDVLSSMDELGMLFIQQGRLADAKKLLQETLVLAQRSLGPDNPVTLETMSDVAYTLTLDGRNGKALDLARHAFETQRRVLGEGATSTLWTMNVLALILGRNDRLAESEQLYRQELDIERRVHGPDSTGALNAMSNLGATLIVMGRLSDGEDIMRQTFDIQHRVNGLQHPETARTLYNLACAVARQGHRDEAFSLLHEAVGAVYLRTLMGMEKDSDLDSLHGDPRWDAILEIAKRRLSAAQKPR